MKEWMDVLPEMDFPPGTSKTIHKDDIEVLVINLGGTFYGLEDCCSHDGNPLSGGEIDGGDIVCPRHGARFDIKTGAALSPPAYENINVLQVRVSHGVIQIKR
ncbi:MAG: Rieske 2Fe-2S domain-containing protein [Magnetococcales bacterium]|nr:Rieske 2Fe-2S domain-containing protein [Magnetococcales bacterium]